MASYYASGDPDGLTKVSEDQGCQTEQEHRTGDALAGYETKGVADGASRAVSPACSVPRRAHDRRGGALVVRRAVPPRRPDSGPPRTATSCTSTGTRGCTGSRHVKLVALVAFMLTVVATPRGWFPVFAGYFLLIFVLVAISHVPPTYLAKRMVVEVPFVVFAALLPFVATGRRSRCWASR